MAVINLRDVELVDEVRVVGLVILGYVLFGLVLS